jgi:hypothetical protein
LNTFFPFAEMDVTETQFALPIPSMLSKATVERVADRVSEKLNFKIGEPLEPVVDRLGGETKNWMALPR